MDKGIERRVLYVVVDKNEIENLDKDECWDLGLTGIGAGDYEKYSHFIGTDKGEKFEICMYQIGREVPNEYIEKQISEMKKLTPTMGYFIL